MIFVTLGSQKFQFNRLLIEIDKLVDEGKITEEVFAQIGYSDYKPKNYKYKENTSLDWRITYLIPPIMKRTRNGINLYQRQNREDRCKHSLFTVLTRQFCANTAGKAHPQKANCEYDAGSH